MAVLATVGLTACGGNDGRDAATGNRGRVHRNRSVLPCALESLGPAWFQATGTQPPASQPDDPTCSGEWALVGAAPPEDPAQIPEEDAFVVFRAAGGQWEAVAVGSIVQACGDARAAGLPDTAAGDLGCPPD